SSINATKISTADASSLTWHDFTPFGLDGNAPGVATIGSQATITMDNVTSVGYFYETENTQTTKDTRSGSELIYFSVTAPAGAPDTTAPTPDPATFASAPSADSDTAISMTATTGSDATGPVEYYFNETTSGPGATDSGWQTSPSYTDSGLDASTQYTYTVQMRDSAPTPNVGTVSSGANATTDSAVTVDTVTVDQEANGGVWNVLGSYNFGTGSSDFVKIRTTNANDHVIADAVKFTKSGQSDVILDSEDGSGITIVGSWTNSTYTSGYLGSNYKHDGNSGQGTKSVTFTPNLPVSGTWQVSMNWTAAASRATNVPVDISYTAP
ncbi:hypothetical protein LCGC14_1947220, partial [marine sediment metagenome]